jgi:Zn-dependent protease with chaperone function
MRALVCLALLSACAVSAVFASGEVWRQQEKFPPAEGPSTVTVAAKGKTAKKAQTAELIVTAKDGADRPVPGLDVTVLALFNKEHSLQKAATDAQGQLKLQGSGVTGLAFGFSWDGGAKTIKVRLEPGKNGAWAVAEAPYKRILDGKDDGSCKNLFALTRDGATGPYRLAFHVPAALVECEQLAYGTERKVGELVKLEAIGKRDVNTGDKNAFTAADEAKMGLEASTQFDSQFEKIDDPQIVGYVQKVMEKVVAASDVPTMPIHLRVVHTNDVNAFVTAGGNVYVFTGLIAMAQNESQLAGVLAHEGSHAVARHVTEGATRGQKAQTGAAVGSQALGALGALLGANEGTQALIQQGAGQAAGLVLLRYDRRSETEADLLGTQYLWKAGWDPEGIARFFELLEKQTAGAGGGPPQWMSTHPSHEKRVENGILWARAFLPPKERYLVDTAEFQAVRERVRKLPPPKPRPKAEGQQKSLVQLMEETPTWKTIAPAASTSKPKSP